ncbi:hypothetical protein [Amaricoccus macauensis]|uniref:hypothetical protein n=1 Tax=Amaricoccus macauensis TaxID=57001 RepID=UPI003C7AC2EF
MKQDGFAVSLQEEFRQTCDIAVPVRDDRGHILAALSLWKVSDEDDDDLARVRIVADDPFLPHQEIAGCRHHKLRGPAAIRCSWTEWRQRCGRQLSTNEARNSPPTPLPCVSPLTFSTMAAASMPWCR